MHYTREEKSIDVEARSLNWNPSHKCGKTQGSNPSPRLGLLQSVLAQVTNPNKCARYPNSKP